MAGGPRITFYGRLPTVVVTGELGDGDWTVTSGRGGWQTVARPLKVGYTQWQGTDPLRVQGPVVFDNFAAGRSIEPELARFERLAELRPGQREPQTVQFDAGGWVPHDFKRDPRRVWVVETLEEGEAARNTAGNRIRQDYTITLLEKVDADTVRMLPTSAKPSKKTSQPRLERTRTIVVKRGEGLVNIAGRELGATGRWVEIAQLNGIRDPRSVREGQRIVIPSS